MNWLDEEHNSINETASNTLGRIWDYITTRGINYKDDDAIREALFAYPAISAKLKRDRSDTEIGVNILVGIVKMAATKSGAESSVNVRDMFVQNSIGAPNPPNRIIDLRSKFLKVLELAQKYRKK